jgi:glycerophosphoryl diester phosphodiesterase
MISRRIWTMLALLVVEAATFCASVSAEDAAEAARHVTQLIAHRGASAERPEHTLASTRRAIEVGATAVEVDVRTTKDGELVLLHDARVDKTTNGKGLVGDMTLAEVRALDAGSHFSADYRGERVASLAEVLTECRDRIDVLLDLKESGDEYARRVVALIKEKGNPRRTIVGVRSVEQARQFRQLLPIARQLGLIAKPEEIEAYAAAGVETIRIWPHWLTDASLRQAALVARVRKAGAKLHLNGTTGTREDTLPLLAHSPDSLSSDNPRQLIATLRELRQSGSSNPHR